MTDPRTALEGAWEHFAQTDPAFRRFACTIIDDRGTTNSADWVRDFGVHCEGIADGIIDGAHLK